MKHLLFKASLVWTGILLSCAGYGQDIPLGALPMQFNSSFAGEADGPRINTNVGSRTPTKTTYYFGTAFGYDWGGGTSVSYDQFISAIRSGIGVSVNYLSYPGRNYTSFGYGFLVAIAPKFSFKGKYTISPSLDFSYNAGRETYEDWGVTGQKQIINSSLIQSRVAILLNAQKWYIGYSINLFSSTQADYSVDPGYILHQNKFNSYWQLGYTFQRSSESKFSVTPQLLFQTGHEWPNRFRYFGFESINLTFHYKKFLWGLNNTGFHLGLQTKQMRVMLSNHFERGSHPNTVYTGNLSFRYVFKKDK